MPELLESNEGRHATARNAADRLLSCWPAARPFAVIGAACIVAGGIVAALSRPTDLELGPWLAAFLVLVGGVAQIALGAGQAWLAVVPPARRRVVIEVATWNLGVALTIIGGVASLPVVTTLGGVAVLSTLALFLLAVRGDGSIAHSLLRTLYVSVTAVVLVSTPIGLALAWIRHG
jgi:hypothetical protein